MNNARNYARLRFEHMVCHGVYDLMVGCLPKDLRTYLTYLDFQNTKSQVSHYIKQMFVLSGTNSIFSRIRHRPEKFTPAILTKINSNQTGHSVDRKKLKSKMKLFGLFAVGALAQAPSPAKNCADCKVFLLNYFKAYNL